MWPRYGGEEFAVSRPEADEAGGDARAVVLLAALRAGTIPHPSGTRVTARVGGTTARDGGLAGLSVVADAARCAAEVSGRDQRRRGAAG